MKEIYLHIDGMYCDNCTRLVTRALEGVPGVASVKLTGTEAHVSADANTLPAALVAAVEAAGYFAKERSFDASGRLWNKLSPRMQSLGIFALSVVTLVAIGAGINAIFGRNIFNAIPAIDSSYSRGMLLGAGVLTGLHCISMCGALNMASSMGGQHSSGLSPVLYNLGRLISYTALGALAGVLGGVIGINRQLASVLLILAAALMIAMALRMAGIISFRLPQPSFKGGNLVSGSGPFVVGLANGFMPCGPLQAMQLYALSLGNAFEGALSMFLFCLGTIPFMLGVGYAARLVRGKARAIVSKVAAAFLFALAVSMLARGLSITGTTGALDRTPGLGTFYAASERLVATQEAGVQTLVFDLDFDTYADVQVKVGVPVRMTIVADPGKITGCNNRILMPAWGIEAPLAPGENVIEFTPTETGVYTYTCWMNMISNTVEVVE